MKESFNKKYRDLVSLKESLKKEFLEYVRDSNKPIIERLELWESYSEELLPVGEWRHQCPKFLFEIVYDHVERYDLMTFNDLKDFISYEQESYGTFDSKGNLIFVSEETTKKLEQIFATGLSGTRNDW